MTGRSSGGPASDGRGGRAAGRTRRRVAASRRGPATGSGPLVRLALVTALVLAGCTPLYVPLVPPDLPPIPPQTRIAQARVDRLGGVPAVVFTPREVPEAGWLQVQWYAPAGDAVASASVWLDEGRIGRIVRVPIPGDVARTREGRWRAVLSFDGRVLRQVEWREAGTGGA